MILTLSLRDRLAQRLLMKLRPAPLACLLKRILSIKRVPFATLHGVFHIDPVSQLGLTLSRDGEYEPAMRKCLEAYLPKGGAFLDIGANEGYFSVIASKLVGNEGQVVAIEPQNRLQEVIQENCRLNSVRNVTVLQTAVSDRSGEQDFYESPSTNTGSSSLARSTKYRLKVQRTTVKTLAEIMDENRMKTVDLLKMDIEGFEYEAVIGSQQVFKEKRVRAFALELHPEAIAGRGFDHLAICKVLEQNGYILISMGESSIWVPAP